MDVKLAIPEALRAFINAGHDSFKCDDGDWQIEIKTAEEAPSKKIPPGSLIIANNGIGDVLFLTSCKGQDEAFGDVVYAFWHEEQKAEVFARNIYELLNGNSKPSARGPIYYADGKTDVRIGDSVLVRKFFSLKEGTVEYVPGISSKDPGMEHHGLCWIKIRLANGYMVSVVDPVSFRLKSKIDL